MLVVDVVVAGPAHRLERDAQVAEDSVVEVIAAEQVVLDQLQELARTGALNHTVIVGAGQGDNLRQALLGDQLLGQATELSRVLKSTHTNNGGLTLRQTGHRVNGTDTAGVGQRHSSAAEVLNGQCTATATLDDVVVSVPELAEAQLLSTLNVRNHQVTRTIRAGNINCQAEVHVSIVNGNGLTLLIHVVGHVHGGHSRNGADDRVTNDVGEGNLTAAGAGQVLVDGATVLNQELSGDRANSRSGGDGQRLFHGRDDRLGGATQGDNLVFSRFHGISFRSSRCGGGGSRCFRRLRCHGSGGGCGSRRSGGGSCGSHGSSRCGYGGARSTRGTGASQRLVDGLKNGPP